MKKVILIGRLTKDPELSFMPTSGKAVERMNNSNKFKEIGVSRLTIIKVIINNTLNN